MRLTVVSVAAQALVSLVQCYDELTAQYGVGLLELNAFYVALCPPPGKQEAICRAVREADTALIDLMGASQELIEAVGEALDGCKGNRIVIGYGCREKTRLGRFSMGAGMGSKEDPGPDSQGAAGKMSGMRRMAQGMRKVLPLPILRDMDNLFLAGDYWQSGTREDIRSLLYLLLREYDGRRQLPKPAPPTLKTGIFLCDPETQQTYETVRDYHRAFPPVAGKPTVAFLFYGHNYPNRFFPVIEQVRKAFLPFANVLPIGFSNQLDRDMARLDALMQEGGVRLVVNFMSFRLGAGPMGGDAQLGVRILEKYDAPMLSPFYLSKRTKAEWERDQEGASPGDFLISMMLPELDGGIETVPLGAVGNVTHDPRFDLDLTEIVPLEGAVSRLAARAKRWLRLQQIPNREKRVALLCYDYPPGEAHLLSAAFLDTLASLSNILSALHDAGYNVPETAPEALEELLCRSGQANSGRFCCEQDGGPCYAPETLEFGEELEAAWGPAPGQIMTDESGYRIPGVRLGNIFIGIQPARTGAPWDGDNHYHDQDLPPHHQYTAYYQWIREAFQADAVVHVGTHGTLEFLPGKANGLTCRCWADRLLGDLPNLYLYYCGNASEGMTAKRRSNAVLLSYAPPVFRESGLYGDLADLDGLLTEYREAERQAPERAAGLLERLQNMAAALELPREPEALERELYRSRTALIPKGLHVYGAGYSESEAEDYADRVTKQDGADAAALARKAMESRELPGLLHALNGGYVPAGPMGDVFRNSDILPTGRNGYAFDPRFVPSPAAYARGEEIAKATLERYQREHGAPPEKLAVVLWGLETTRTQGETVGQLLYYLGVRMTWRGTSFLSRLEVIPTRELGRRRLDVTVTICGFFRDLFPNLLEDLDRVLRELDDLRETPEQSAFAAHTEQMYQELLAEGYEAGEARELARSRIFGPANGEYGTSLTNLVKSGQWETPEELGSIFTGELGYVYGGRRQGERVPGLLQRQLGQVELLTQVRSDPEYEVTDLDHYYEFFGGLSRAVENARGVRAEQYIVDTTGQKALADTLAESAARGIRTRLLNPVWIDGMLAHSFHGGQKIAARFENVLGLAATAEAVSSASFDRLHSAYVADPDLRRRMRENNRYAYLEVLEKLMESSRRGYWHATEQQLDELTRAYLETEGDVEDA